MNDGIACLRAVALTNLRDEQPLIIGLIGWELSARGHTGVSRALTAWRHQPSAERYRLLVKAISRVLWHYIGERRPPASTVAVVGKHYRIYSRAARADCTCDCRHQRYLGFCTDCDTPAFHDNDGRTQCCHHLAMRTRLRQVWPQGQYQT